VKLDAATRVLRFYRRFVEPLRFARVRAERLRDFGQEPEGPLPIAHIDPGHLLPTCRRSCARRIEGMKWYLSTVRDAGEGADSRFRGTMTLIDRTEYADFEVFERTVRKATKDAVGNKVRKALKNGYTARRINRKLHEPDVAAIRKSKRFRSGGLVPWSFLPMRVAAPFGRRKLYRVRQPRCLHHWRVDFGVFLPEPGHRQGPFVVNERLVGIINLARSGNIIRTTEVLGHGDHLAAGVMDLLMMEVMRWIFAGGEGATEGVDYICYGKAEHGAPGLGAWKRKYGFRAHLWAPRPRADALSAAAPRPALAAPLPSE